MTPPEAEQLISLPKEWAGGPIALVAAKKSAVRCVKFRSALNYNAVTLEGLFVEIVYAPSILRPKQTKISYSFIANTFRLVGVDQGPPSRHVNHVGRGLPYHLQRADHPHLHYTVHDAVEGYAEPLAAELGPSELWQIFLRRANISGSPTLEIPATQWGLI